MQINIDIEISIFKYMHDLKIEVWIYILGTVCLGSTNEYFSIVVICVLSVLFLKGMAEISLCTAQR